MLSFKKNPRIMTSNQKLITQFYESFQNKDVSAMQDCYSEKAQFSDPVFSQLNGSEVRAMWAMLLRSGKDLRIEFTNVQASENGGTAEWTAYYTFSATGNKVVNRIKASFVIEGDKITVHKDHFNFYIWAKQALGTIGLILGWTNFLKNKIRKKAKSNLDQFMASR